MNNVIYKGLSISKSSENKYTDTIAIPVISTSGNDGVNKIEKNYKKYYNNYDFNISDNIANYLKDLGYNLLVQRMIPYKNNILDSKNGIDSYLCIINEIESGFYIKITGNSKTILIWYGDNSLNEILEVSNSDHIYKLFGNDWKI